MQLLFIARIRDSCYINTQGLFGITFQAQDNPFTNDIIANSEQGLQGDVDITLPDVDPDAI